MEKTLRSALLESEESLRALQARYGMPLSSTDVATARWADRAQKAAFDAASSQLRATQRRMRSELADVTARLSTRR